MKDLFTQIASRYDLINDLQSFGLHRLWKRRVVRLAQPRPGLRALDLCCGTGDIAYRLAEAGAEVTALDFSERMLEVARSKQRADARAAPTPRFIRGDAQRIPFANDSFDIVTIAYGLRNLAQWQIGLDEMYRAAAPGGRLVILEFGRPELSPLRMLYFTYLRVFVPLLGLIFCRNPSAYAYILESLKHYPAQRGVAARMKEIGLTNVRVTNLLGGVMNIHYGERAVRLPTSWP